MQVHWYSTIVVKITMFLSSNKTIIVEDITTSATSYRHTLVSI